jgi:hypothetical protein
MTIVSSAIPVLPYHMFLSFDVGGLFFVKRVKHLQLCDEAVVCQTINFTNYVLR